MEIDEKREKYDLSVHCMGRLSQKNEVNKRRKEKEETIEIYRLKIINGKSDRKRRYRYNDNK